MSTHIRMPRGWMATPALMSKEPLNRREVWIWIIEMAAPDDGAVVRGGIASTVAALGRAWGWKPTKVRRALSDMIACGLLAGTIDRDGTVRIRLAEYDAHGISRGEAQTDCYGYLVPYDRSRHEAGPPRLDVSPGEWARLRQIAFARFGYVCRYCGDERGPFDCDHVIPVSRGGLSEPDNLVPACQRCNRSKGARTPREWEAARGH